MKLLTKEIIENLKKHPLYSTDGKDKKECIVKFFNPMGSGTWYVFEGQEQEDGDWLFFGLVDLFEKELGYFTLSELQSVNLPFGMGIERDMYFEGLYDLEKGEFERILGVG